MAKIRFTCYVYSEILEKVSQPLLFGRAGENYFLCEFNTFEQTLSYLTNKLTNE